MKRFIANFKKYKFLLFELVKRDVKLKYRSSMLGFLWTLIEPLLTMIVLTIIFGTLFGREKNFSVYILCGRLMFSYFSNGTKLALKSIRRNGRMLRKVYVPKYMYPLSSALSAFVTFAISLVVLVGVSLVQRIWPTIHVIEAIVPLFTLFLLVFSLGIFLSVLDVFFRDLEYIWNVVTMLIMYASAIFYYPEKVLVSEYAFLLKYNPLYAVINNFRRTIMYGQSLEFFSTWYPLAVAVVFGVIGMIFFYKKQDEFILYV